MSAPDDIEPVDLEPVDFDGDEVEVTQIVQSLEGPEEG